MQGFFKLDGGEYVHKRALAREPADSTLCFYAGLRKTFPVKNVWLDTVMAATTSTNDEEEISAQLSYENGSYFSTYSRQKHTTELMADTGGHEPGDHQSLLTHVRGEGIARYLIHGSVQQALELLVRLRPPCRGYLDDWDVYSSDHAPDHRCFARKFYRMRAELEDVD